MKTSLDNYYSKEVFHKKGWDNFDISYNQLSISALPLFWNFHENFLSKHFDFIFPNALWGKKWHKRREARQTHARTVNNIFCSLSRLTYLSYLLWKYFSGTEWIEVWATLCILIKRLLSKKKKKNEKSFLRWLPTYLIFNTRLMVFVLLFYQKKAGASYTRLFSNSLHIRTKGFYS